jgi:hypothetical protein
MSMATTAPILAKPGCNVKTAPCRGTVSDTACAIVSGSVAATVLRA